MLRALTTLQTLKFYNMEMMTRRRTSLLINRTFEPRLLVSETLNLYNTEMTGDISEPRALTILRTLNLYNTEMTDDTSASNSHPWWFL